jgi:hypothetical protein
MVGQYWGLEVGIVEQKYGHEVSILDRIRDWLNREVSRHYPTCRIASRAPLSFEDKDRMQSRGISLYWD